MDFASEVPAQSDFPEENDWKDSLFLNWDRIKKHPKLCLNLNAFGTSSEGYFTAPEQCVGAYDHHISFISLYDDLHGM